MADLDVLSTTELFPGCLHVLVHASHTPVPSPGGTPPPGDCYQLLLGVREHVSPRLARAFIGRVREGQLAGLAVYDALQDPRSAELLLERLRQPGTTGPLHFEADPSVSVPAGLAPRLLGAEQSNSSLVYGDRYILKVFRRIQPGVNPDLELPGALAAQGCKRVPAPVAWFRTAEPRAATLGVLQPFLPDASDGWALALRALADGDEFTTEAYELGQATADVHLALAAAFPSDDRPLAENDRTAAAMTERLEAAAHPCPRCGPSCRGCGPRSGRSSAVMPGLPPSVFTAICISARYSVLLPRLVRHRLRGRAVQAAGRAAQRAVPGAGHRRDAAVLRLRGPAAPTLAPAVGAPLPGGLLRGLRGPGRLGPADQARPAARVRDRPRRV